MLSLDLKQRALTVKLDEILISDEMTDELFACVAIIATANDRLQTEGGCIICYGYDKHDDECALRILKELLEV